MTMAVFSAGDCPVCPGFGAAILVLRYQTHERLYLCPMCGSAWLKPPGGSVDEISRISEFAPDGVVLPSPDNDSCAGMSQLPPEEWLEALAPYLAREGSL